MKGTQTRGATLSTLPGSPASVVGSKRVVYSPIALGHRQQPFNRSAQSDSTCLINTAAINTFICVSSLSLASSWSLTQFCGERADPTSDHSHVFRWACAKEPQKTQELSYPEQLVHDSADRGPKPYEHDGCTT